MELWAAGVTQEIVEHSPAFRIFVEIAVATVLAALLFGPAANGFFGTTYF